jgi:hypothetical protein
VTAFWFPECDLELDVEIGTRWQLHGTRGPVYELREVNPREFDHTYPYALALVAYDEKNERRKLGEMICVEREWFDASHVRRI